ncbi:MAG: cysteine--tRNA ligase [Bacilli bacterium]|nr:cysteine--tRNA ligase [Bacilli bacterium]
MSIKLYNVLTRKKEEFVPLDGNKVKMYACGITASGNAHIGHAYQAIIFDVVKKYLDYSGYDVTYVRNYTDVDDKIIIKARELGVNPKDFAEEMMAKIDLELAAIFVDKPTIQSKATECIPDMIEFIQKLIDSKHAYVTEYGDVFFDVRSFAEYGKLSNRIVEDSLSGVRKDVEPGKRDDKDFALWKKAGNDEIWWDSPWGKGRPGWHIECSTMSMKYLGDQIDIHGGGKDLIFPHHENEIAQSESLTGKQFSKYWMHNGLIKVNGQKMSKSLNNGILLEDLLKEYNPEIIRMSLLENNYRSDMNVMDGFFDQHEEKIYRIYQLFQQIDSLYSNYKPVDNSLEFQQIDEDFRSAMDNDFNTSLAITYIFKGVKDINLLMKRPTEEDIQKIVNMKDSFIKVYKVLGLLQQSPLQVIQEIRMKHMKKNGILEDEVLNLISERKKYKDEKEWNQADQVREKLLKMGITIKDSSDKTEWDIIF